jgi:hypothetical protein
MTDLEHVDFRVYVGGALVDSVRITFDDDDTWGRMVEHAARQADLCHAAGVRGVPWMVEVIFWDGEHVRWGTDVDGMVVPVEIGFSELLDVIKSTARRVRMTDPFLALPQFTSEEGVAISDAVKSAIAVYEGMLNLAQLLILYSCSSTS